MKSLFPPTTPVTLSKRDERRLSTHMISTRRLNEILVMDSISTDDLKRMVIIEAQRPHPRTIIVRKLVGRIHSRERQRILDVLRG